MATLTLDDLRRAACRLPDVTETTHFRLPAFTVRGKAFLVLQQGDTHAIVHLGEDEAARANGIAPRQLSCHSCLPCSTNAATSGSSPAARSNAWSMRRIFGW